MPKQPDAPADTVGKRLKVIRNEKRLSRRTLATLSGVHDLTILRLEMHNTNPALSTVQKLAAALEVPIAELTG
jgi:transcriptional regulator with XRE-family HTH domain